MSATLPYKYFSRTSIYDHLFWIFLFLFTDPGGIIKANSGGKFYVNFAIFIFLTFLFFFTSGARECLRSRNLNSISPAIFLWTFYYLLVFGLLNNKATDLWYFLKNGFLLPFTAICLFYYSYFFAVRNLKLFIHYLVIFSMIVFSLFFITYFTDFKVLQLRVYGRGYVEQERIMLFGYGILPLSIPLAINILLFNIKMREKRWILLVAAIMIVFTIISITRRQLLETMIYTAGAYLLAIRLKLFRQVIPGKLIIFLLIPVLILFLLFPGYIGATRQSLVESYSVITEGQSTTGQRDARLSLTGQDMVIGKFLENPLLGTGFDPLWYSSEGDRKGFEASDYIFLGALAQHGILGLLFFLPVYFFIYKTLFSEYKVLKRSKRFPYPSEYDRMMVYYLIISFSIKLLIYVNYFVEAGWANNAYSFYILIGILYAVRYRRLVSAQTPDPVEVNGAKNT